MARQIRKQVRRTRRSLASSALMVVALLALTAAPALAHHKADHAHGGGSSAGNGKSAHASDHDGDADSDSSTAYTEDNDTNDGGTPNNVADEGDNKHPSGKDRSVESGKSGNQGKSESHPDDSKGPMRFEGRLGADKPNGSGGTDLADQDGNNGCGNDDDFDDDNNGWCGRKPKDEEVRGNAIEVCPAGTDMAGLPLEKCNEDEAEVEGRIDRALPKAVMDAEVLGSRIDAARPAVRSAKVTAAVLPFTGSGMLTYLLSGLSLVSLGALALLYRSDS